MHDRDLLMLIQSLRDADALADGRPAREAGCLSMARLHSASAAIGLSAAESAHVHGCRKCSARMAAFGAPQRTAASRRAAAGGVWQRLALGAAGAAACAAALIAPRAEVTTQLVTHAGAMHFHTGCVPCDVNCDGVLNSRDIDAFVLAVLHPGQYQSDFPHCDAVCSADANLNCALDDDDMDRLLACVMPR
ncbi:MAG: hypothetical protein IPM64_04790 [Phycisphaerales bacterium]|nr:hypothetical protein [Phycisphaerales bacterium]